MITLRIEWKKLSPALLAVFLLWLLLSPTLTAQKVLTLVNSKTPDQTAVSFEKESLIILYPVDSKIPKWSMTAKLIDYQNDSLVLEIYKDIEYDLPDYGKHIKVPIQYYWYNKPRSTFFKKEERSIHRLALDDFHYIQKNKKGTFGQAIAMAGMSFVFSGAALYLVGRVAGSPDNDFGSLKRIGGRGVQIGFGLVAISLPFFITKKYNLKPKLTASDVYLPAF